jgi:hypothetical protein
MKKITSVLLIVVMLATMLAVTGLAAEPAVGVEARAEVSYGNDLVTLVIIAKEGTTNGKLTVQYDTTALTYEGVEVAGTVSSDIEKNGTVTFGYATSCSDALSAGDTIATLRFSVVPGTRSTRLTVTETELNGENESVVLPTVYVSFYTAGVIETPGGNSGKPSTGTTTEDTTTDDTTIEIVDTDLIPGTSFDDVKKSQWSYEAISYVTGKGYFKGTSATLFSPSANMTRAMFVTVLGRMAGEEDNTNAVTAFQDVPTGKYYTGYVAWAADNGIVLGTSATTFSPDDNVTREQMAVFLYRYAKYLGLDVSAKTGVSTMSTFDDAGSVSSWAVDAMTWAVSNGIINGTGKGLEPQSFATREQVAQIIYNFSKLVG